MHTISCLADRKRGDSVRAREFILFIKAMEAGASYQLQCAPRSTAEVFTSVYPKGLSRLGPRQVEGVALGCA
jgi:hypothetical protein